MFEAIRANQLNLMLLLCGTCGMLIFLLLVSRFLSKSRKWILILMELAAFFLLWFDRLTYIYGGDPSQMGYFMVRLSNFMVFLLTPGIVFGFNLYQIDLLTDEGQMETVPRRLRLVNVLSAMGMLLAVIAAFTNLYYYFDAYNMYHRGDGFLIAFIIPIACPLIQFTVVLQFRKHFSKPIFISLILFIVVPVVCGIVQIFTPGLSIVNMAMVAVSVSLYILMYLDMIDTIERVHGVAIKHMQGEQKHMQRLFDQTATAFVSAVEKKDDFTKGNAIRIAEYAKRIAEMAGKSEEDCEKVYYAALLHDVGLIGIPDEVIKNASDPKAKDHEIMHQKPGIGREILSCITEYPYLSQGAYYSHERYNGTGYPEGLSGKEIPEIARIIAVADAYVTMTTKKRYREARPYFVAREAFVKGTGEQFDPTFAEIMIKIIDADSKEMGSVKNLQPETELVCTEYRQQVSTGIAVEKEVKRITFDCETLAEGEYAFSAPSIILFDAYDGRTHDEEKAIEAYHYLEYGEVWFDKYNITTAARVIREDPIDDAAAQETIDGSVSYEILAGRYDDHLKLVMKAKDFAKEVIVALPNGSKAAYIGLTGEHCFIKNVAVESLGRQAAPEDIPRIAEPISFIDHLEADLKNVQISRFRSAATEGVALKNRLRLAFHTMTLPSATLVWHCPYVVIYSADDGKVDGANYREYALIKINGEKESTEEFAVNRFTMKRTADFPGWDAWKETNKEGMECVVAFERKDNRIRFKTENLGIEIENVTTISEGQDKVYVALTGDEVALTDIRIL